MAEIDPVILAVKAEVDRYQADLKRSTRTVEQQFGLQERRVKALENQFRASSSNIALSLKSLAGTLATAFTGRELIALIDQYTRFQNSLRVAGLEGENLAQVQERLFQTGSRYGVSVNALADLYGKAEQAGRDLGASQSELLSLTDAVAQSLLVSGVSTEQASGAILGLSQALASGTVRAEEFNQINEGGLRVLLEAAAAGDRFGGSVSKLRQAVLDGKVSSQQFYRAILANTDLIESRAAKANLTLSGAITALRDSLARYVGEAATANGVTGALAGGIQLLAENLDTVIPTLATIASLIGVRFVASLGQAALANVALQGALAGTAVQMGALGAASFALQARLAGAATTTEALTFAMRGLSAVAAGSLIGGLIYLAATTEDTTAATERLTAAADEAEAKAASYEKRLRDAGVQVDATGKGADIAADKVAGFAGQMLVAADAALKMADALRIADLAKIGSRIQEIDREAARLSSIETNRPSRQSSGSLDGLIGRGVRDYVVPLAERLTGQEAQGSGKRLAELQREKAALERQAILIGKAAEAGLDLGGDGAGGTGGGTAGKPKKGPKGPQGPTNADRLSRFLDEQARLDAEILQAKIGLASSIEDRAALEREFLTQQGEQRRADIDAQVAAKQLTAEQGVALKAEIDALYGAAAEYDEQGNIIATLNNGLIAQEVRQREQADLERQRIDVLEERGRAEIDALRLQFDLADTEKERRAIALQILDAEQRLALAREEEVLQSQTASKEAKEIAALRKSAILSQALAQRASTDRQFEGPLARFARNAKDSDTAVAEAAVRRIEDLNQTITDAMTNALGIKDPFLSQLIKIFLDRNVFGPLAEGLSGAGGGDFLSGVGSLIGGLFGRASGGPVAAGRAYRVNEGAPAGRVEAFVPNTSGQIIPLGRMNALTQGGGQAGGVATVRLQLSGDIDARIESVSAGVAVEVVRQSAPQIVDAAANETLSRASRPRL